MQRKSGIYRGRFYYKGETYTKDNADLKKLVQEMEDLRYEVKHGLKGKGDNITLDTWFDIWLNTHKKRTIKESTQVRYDDFYRRYIKKQIGKQRVADFNPIILERLLQNMADDDYSTKTIRDVYNILNAMFKYAVHNRILTFNPCAGVEVPKTKTKQIRVLTVKEQREVLEHAKERIHENTYRNEGYVDLASPVFRSDEFKALKAKEKYLALEFRKRSFETGKGYKHGVRAFYEAWDKSLGVTDRTIRGYIHSLSKVCGFFSIGIKDGFYRITSRICFKKPAKGQEGHRYDQDMYNEQSVRMELNRDNIKYDKTGFDDTVFLMYQYASAFAKKHANVKTYLSAAIHNSISGHKWRDRSLSAPTVHHHLKAILEGLKDVPETQSVKSNSKSKENRFNSFSQRDNDYGELESLLLNSTI